MPVSSSNETDRADVLLLGPQAAPPGRRWGLTTLTGRLWPIALGFGALIFVAAMALDWFLLLDREAPLLTVAISNGVVGLLAGVLLSTLLEYGRAQRRMILRRIDTLNEVNHHIRNALQAIAFSIGALKDHEEAPKISDAMTRIRWVLRELLPKLEPTYEPFEGSTRQAGEFDSLHATADRKRHGQEDRAQ